MKEETRPEMTAEEFANQYAPKEMRPRKDNPNIWDYVPIEDFLADLRSVIRGKMVEYEEWAQNQNYFKRPVPSAEQIVDEFLSNNQ